MPRKSFEVQIEPEILKWVIRNSGWTIEEVSKKVKVSNAVIDGWLSGDKKPTLYQIKTLSNYLKRPLAVFFLSKPPEEKSIPHDFRMLPEKSGSFDKKTLLAIRKARRLQSISKELLQNLDISTRTKINQALLSETPENIAAHERTLFGVSVEEQTKWGNAYQAFNTWRKSIEDRNIMVFQLSMPIEDTRGFSLVDEEPFIIIINLSDSIEARIFTLLHEYAHILLDESGVCIPERLVTSAGRDAKFEKWCNEFAAAFLLPKQEVREDFRTGAETDLLESQTLSKLSQKYKVSKSAVLLSMLKLGFINRQTYQDVMDKMKATKKKIKRKRFGLSSDRRCLQEKGEKFISLVSRNVDNGFITNSDALDYLSIKSKHYNKIRAKITG